MLYTISSLRTINTGFPISQIALSEDGSFAVVAPDATVAARNFITIVNTSNGAITNVVCPNNVVWSSAVAISPDMQRIYAVGGGRVNVFKKTNGVWAYERLLASINSTTIGAIGVAADNIDIAYSTSGVVRFYNTQTDTEINNTGTGSNIYHTVGGFAATPYNAFIIARTANVGNSFTQWVKTDNGTYVARTPEDTNVFDCWYTPDGGFISGIRTVSTTNLAVASSRLLATQELELTANTGRTLSSVTNERVIPITNEIYFSVTTGAPSVVNVKLASNNTTLYSLNHTLTGTRARYRSGQLITFSDSVASFDIVGLKTGENANVKVTPLNTVQYYPRSFRNASVTITPSKDRYFAITGVQSTSANFRTAPIKNYSFANSSLGAATNSTNANSFSHGSSDDGRMFVFGRPEGYTYVRLSKISEFSISSSTGLASLNGLNKIYATSPSGEYVAMPGSSGLQIVRYTRAGGQSSVTTSGMSAVDYLGTMFLSNINLLALRVTNLDILAQGTGSTTFVRQNTLLHGTDNATNFVVSDNKRRVAILYQNQTPQIYIFNTPNVSAPSGFKITGTTGALTEPRAAAFSPSGNKLFVRDDGNTWAMYNVTDTDATKAFSYTFPKTAKINPVWLTENIVRVFLDNDKLSHRNFLVGATTLTDITNLGYVDSLPSSSTWNTVIAPNGSFIIRTGFTNNNNTATGTNTTLLYRESTVLGNYLAPAVLGPSLPNYQTSLAAIGPDSQTFVLVDNTRQRFFFYEKEPGVAEPVLRQTITRASGFAKEYDKASGEFSPDGNFVAFGYGTNLYLFRKNGAVFEDITIPNVGPDKSFAKFSNNGMFLYVGGYDTSSQSQPIKIFKLQGKNYVFSADTTLTAITAMDIAPSGIRAVFSTSTQTVVRSIDVATGAFGAVIATLPASTKATFITDTLLAVATVSNPNIQIMEIIGNGVATWPANLNDTFGTTATNVSIAKINISERRIVVGFPTDVAQNSSSSSDVDTSTAMLPLLFKVIDDRTKGEANIILPKITTTAVGFVAGTLAGDTVIPSVKVTGFVTTLRDVAGDTQLPMLQSSTVVDLRPEISGDTEMPQIVTDASGNRLPSLDGDTKIILTYISEGELNNGVASSHLRNCYVTPKLTRENAKICKSAKSFGTHTFGLMNLRDCGVTELSTRNGSGKVGCGPRLISEPLVMNEKTTDCAVADIRDVVGKAICRARPLTYMDKGCISIKQACIVTPISVVGGPASRNCGTEYVTVNLPAVHSIRMASLLCHIPSAFGKSVLADRVCVPQQSSLKLEYTYRMMRSSILCYSADTEVKQIVGDSVCTTIGYSKTRTFVKSKCIGLYIPSMRSAISGTKICPYHALLVGIQPRIFGRIYKGRPYGMADIQSGRQNISIR